MEGCSNNVTQTSTNIKNDHKLVKWLYLQHFSSFINHYKATSAYMQTEGAKDHMTSIQRWPSPDLRHNFWYAIYQIG